MRDLMPMSGRSWMRVLRYGWTATLLVAASCKKPAPPPPEPAPPPAPSASAQATAAPPVVDASHREAKPAKPPPGKTAEAIVAEAQARVAEAIHVNPSKESCGEVLRLLDVSFTQVRSTTTLEPATLKEFSTCALRGGRWHLLRELAEETAASSPALKTTFLLPRAMIGEGEYGPALALAKATLRAWPKDGEAYTTGALASARQKDWEGCKAAADQALLIQHKKGSADSVTSLAHALRGAALLHLGKVDEGIHDLEAVKQAEALAVAGVTLDAARGAKQSGILVSVDLPDEAFPALFSLYAKSVTPLSGLVTIAITNLGDHPAPLVVEASLTGADPASETVTVTKGRPVSVSLTPPPMAAAALAALITPEPRELAVVVTSGTDHATVYRQEGKVTLEPASQLPTVLQSHGDDRRSAFALEAAWVTPASPAVASLLDAAKARLHDGRFDGAAGASGLQVQALWDELRSRGVSFHRKPEIDSEAHESQPCHLPTDILANGTGNALESSTLFASMLEAIGLNVILVRIPGHRLVGWLPTKADSAANETSAVKSPLGKAFFLETTMVGDGPFDAALLRGAAEWVAEMNNGAVASGRSHVESLAALRKAGITPLTK